MSSFHTRSAPLLGVCVVLGLSAPATLCAQAELAIATPVAGAVVVTSGMYDLFTASRSAKRYNATLAQQLGKQPKSPSEALRRSAIATIIPTVVGTAMIVGSHADSENGPLLTAGISITALGWIVGPSAGHWYAEQRETARRGIVIRGVSAVIGVVALIVALPALGD